MDRCLAWSSFVAFPLCAAMAVSIQPLVTLLLGPVWQPSGIASLPLIALTAWLFLAFPAGVGVIARGEPRYTLIANIAGTTATAVGVLLLQPGNPLQAVLVWLGAQVFVSPYILWANGRVLGTTPLRPLRAGVPLLSGITSWRPQRHSPCRWPSANHHRPPGCWRFAWPFSRSSVSRSHCWRPRQSGC